MLQQKIYDKLFETESEAIEYLFSLGTVIVDYDYDEVTKQVTYFSDSDSTQDTLFNEVHEFLKSEKFRLKETKDSHTYTKKGFKFSIPKVQNLGSSGISLMSNESGYVVTSLEEFKSVYNKLIKDGEVRRMYSDISLTSYVKVVNPNNHDEFVGNLTLAEANKLILQEKYLGWLIMPFKSTYTITEENLDEVFEKVFSDEDSTTFSLEKLDSFAFQLLRLKRLYKFTNYKSIGVEEFLKDVSINKIDESANIGGMQVYVLSKPIFAIVQTADSIYKVQ